jgi:uroporphyrinogen decarboxylase
MPTNLLARPVTPDGQAFLACLQRVGTPQRVHVIELGLDWEIEEAIIDRFSLRGGWRQDAEPYWLQKRHMAVQRFLGYDYVRVGIEGADLKINRAQTEDTATLGHARGRSFVDESRGPITSWADFAQYPWPDPAQFATRALEWFERNLPEDMCVVCRGVAHFAEHLAWLMGYETLCYALHDDRALVKAIYDRLLQVNLAIVDRMLQFSRVRCIWASDDMGFKTGPLISPADLREFVLPGHRAIAARAHAAGRPYILHSCGNVACIMADLINDVCIDAKHSFEDTIEDVCDVKRAYGSRIAVLGGIDVDFLCRADEQAIRRRVRDTLAVCQPGGGYCLGTGNSVANYIPVENYLIMLDEGRKYNG